VFAFFRVEMLGMPTEGNVFTTFPMTVVHSPSYAKSSFGAEAYLNYRMLDLTTLDHYVNAIAITPEPLVKSKYLDFNSQLDYATEIGSYSEYLADAIIGTPAGWRYHSEYSAVNDVIPYNGRSIITQLDDPTSNWEANTPIQITSGLVPLDLFNSSFIVREPYMKFTWLDANRKVKTIYAKLVKDSVYHVLYGYYTFEFSEAVPVELQGRDIHLNAPSDSNIDNLLTEGYAIAELAFNKIEFGDASAITGYTKTKGFCDMMLGYDIKGTGTIADPVLVPITLEVNGNVYGNFEDPLEALPVSIKHYYDTPPDNDGVLYPTGNYFEIELPEFCSWFSMGAPAIGEIETLPVASLQQDMTDAKKNIDYVSAILYQTKGLRVGESEQPDTELERFDFTTDDSVTEPVAFSGPKSYNFGSTWNDHGKIRVSGMDLQPFNISGIIPKGNVGGYGG
jgi:hypothetical protein